MSVLPVEGRVGCTPKGAAPNTGLELTHRTGLWGDRRFTKGTECRCHHSSDLGGLRSTACRAATSCDRELSWGREAVDCAFLALAAGAHLSIRPPRSRDAMSIAEALHARSGVMPLIPPRTRGRSPPGCAPRGLWSSHLRLALRHPQVLWSCSGSLRACCPRLGVREDHRYQSDFAPISARTLVVDTHRQPWYNST